jgi:hypothetical protein
MGSVSPAAPSGFFFSDVKHSVYIFSHILIVDSLYTNKIDEFLKNIIRK